MATEKEPLALDWTSYGWAVMRGEAKLAVVYTQHHAGLYRNGIAILEDFPHHQWHIHFTSPSMRVEDLLEIADLIPKEWTPRPEGWPDGKLWSGKKEDLQVQG